MKYFITGATGFIGGQLARQLVGAGHEVIALARKPAKDLADLGIKVCLGDITEKESMRGRRVAVVLSGGNVDSSVFASILEKRGAGQNRTDE